MSRSREHLTHGVEAARDDVLLSELKPAHFDEVLCDLRNTLLALVDREARPVNELLVNLVKRTSKRAGLVRRAAMHTLVQVPSCSCSTT